jgi:hypothetical protein
MTRDELYVRTLEDVTRIAERPRDEFDLLLASAHLRKLLVDEDPLVHQVNRERRLKLWFEPSAEDAYTVEVMKDDPIFYSPMDGFSPRLDVSPFPVTKETINLPRLLERRVAYVHGQDYSVRDLILQVANVEGGVHAGTPRSEVQKMLATAFPDMLVGGASWAVRCIRGIADVVVLGLEPLTARVRSDLGLDPVAPSASG